MITFANPIGFLALLGIPIILLIHFLQRQSQVITVSTLFLLEALDRENIKGRKFDRIRNSVPLWLQLLAVLLLTWILVQPRWMLENSVQKICLVLDSSASMKAFSDPLLSTLEKELPQLGRGARMVELTALESHLEGKPLYNGTSVVDLLDVLKTWEPFRSAHDPGPALRVGRSLAGPRGILVYVTDHPVEPPGYNAAVLSVGEMIDNVGFAAIEVHNETEPPSWEALVRNYAATPQEREWFLESGQQRTDTRVIEMEPDETRTLQGRFPEGSSRLTLHLSPDAFDQDDSAPFVVPVPKRIVVAKTGSPKIDPDVERIMGSLENVEKASSGDVIDLYFTSYNPLSPTTPEKVSVVFLAQNEPGRFLLKGPIVASNHRLISDLNWQGLEARSSPGMPVAPTDSVLLWQGERELIFLREEGENRQLVFNFDIPSSEGARAAFAILVWRFVEDVRYDKIASFSRNTEVHQSIRIAHDRTPEAAPLQFLSDSGGITIPLKQVQTLRTPGRPGFFEVRQGENLLMTGAAHFADTREADFSGADQRNELGALKGEVETEHTRSDDIWQLWLLLFLAALVLSWFFINRKPLSETGPAPA